MRLFVVFLLTLTLLHSATINGSIYSLDSFEKINNTILKFDGKSSYQLFSRNGTYSLELEPGTYNLTAFHLENGKVDYVTYEKITVGTENQTFDIVLMPPDFFESEVFPNLDVEVVQKKQEVNIISIFLALLIISLAIAIILSRKYIASANAKKETQANKEVLGEDEMKVLRILKENEGRIEQKMLRDILKFSESKMSLLLTELEVSGYIKRFKKGRENIVKLKKEI